MSSSTTNYNLTKPAGTDYVDIDDINGNMDVIDATMKQNADGIAALRESVSSYLTTTYYVATVERIPSSSTSISAPSVSGYTFVCWFYSSTSGWVSATYIENPLNQNTSVWVGYNPYTNGTGRVNCYALYRKNV